VRLIVALLSVLCAAGWWQAVRRPPWRLRVVVSRFEGTARTWGDLLEFSPDGRTLAVASNTSSPFDRDGQVIDVVLVDPITGKPIRAMKAALTGCSIRTTLAFTPDGRAILATADAGPGERVVIAWDVASGRELARFGVDQGPQSEVDFAFPPGGRALLASQAGALREWDLDSWHARDVPMVGQPPGLILALAPEGRTVAVDDTEVEGEGEGEAIAIRRVADRSTTARLRRGADGLQDEGGVDLGFSPDGTVLAVASGPAQTRGPRAVDLVDAATGRRRTLLAPNFERLSFAPDGRTLVLSRDSTPMCFGAPWLPSSVQVWDVASGTPRFAERQGAHFIGFAPDGTIGITQFRIHYAWTGYLPPWAVRWLARFGVLDIGSSGEFSFIDTATGRTRSTLGRPEDGVSAMAMARDRMTLATLAGGKIIVWDAKP